MLSLQVSCVVLDKQQASEKIAKSRNTKSRRFSSLCDAEKISVVRSCFSLLQSRLAVENRCVIIAVMDEMIHRFARMTFQNVVTSSDLANHFRFA